MDQASDTAPNVISLVSSQDSKITDVSLYTGRAEITRLFKFAIKQGQNQVTIIGLPFKLQEDSVRVEGRGNASIHDVIISRTVPNSHSAHLRYTHADNPLKRKREETRKALASAKEARATLDLYLGTVKANEVDISNLEAMLDGYSNIARKLDSQVLDLEKELSEIEQEIEMEGDSLQENNSPTWQAAINVHGEVEEEVTILVKYVVLNADWTPSYDIRVDAQSKEKNITIVYKAAIAQNTGESWEGVPLTLETATPTFGVCAPKLWPWNLTISTPMPTVAISHPSAQQPVIIMQPRERSRSRSRSPARRRRSRSPSPAYRSPTSRAMQHQTVTLSNKGSIAATFRVPGYINVPSDARKHNVAIAKLELDASLLWYTIPKADARVHLKAKIKNESEYTFIPGSASVYLDGSFVATTSIPSVSPQEVFDCPLGLDPSIRVTYHPREKKAAQSGFYTKTRNESFTQRITLFNTKSSTINNLKVTDALPVSQDERIEVKLLNPALTLTQLNNSSFSTSTLKNKGSSGGGKQKMSAVQVSKSVTAQWDGTDEPGVDQAAVGKNGMVSWLVSLASQEIVTLALHYEVNVPQGLVISGL